ncbi:hypothetical protein KSP40_PGU008525 [Platanthera guangdongensis]|uniref:Uncharacterized protein n=1 Tax=Platanthera guangdongensis TaxID=2320717 RepID=A0ABR2LR56_9ASPA
MMQTTWNVARTTGIDNKSITGTQEYGMWLPSLLYPRDFCTLKPALHYISANRMLDHDKSNDTVLTREEMAVIKTTCSIKPSIPKKLNEVVQVPVKAPPLSQSQAYQSGTFPKEKLFFV